MLCSIASTVEATTIDICSCPEGEESCIDVDPPVKDLDVPKLVREIIGYWYLVDFI
jgi:hypothetical protein